MDQRTGGDGQVLAVHHRVEVGACRTEPAAATYVAVELGEALLLEPVDVVGDGITGFLHRLEERAEQRVGGRSPFQFQRTAVSAVLIGPLGGQAVLHLLEVGEAVRVVPRLHARVCRPAFEVQRVAALEDHPVDAARAAQHLAAGVVDLAAVHERLRLALVLPVVELAADRERQRRRHVDEDIPLVIGTAGLEHQHAGGRIRAETVGQSRAGGTTTDDDIVEHGHSCTRSAVAATSRPTSSASVSPGNRYAGPWAWIAPTTRPRESRIGAATELSPSRNSSKAHA